MGTSAIYNQSCLAEGMSAAKEEDLGLTAVFPAVFLEPLRLYVFSLPFLAFLNLYFQQFHYTVPRVRACVHACACVQGGTRAHSSWDSWCFLNFCSTKVGTKNLLVFTSSNNASPQSLWTITHSKPRPHNAHGSLPLSVFSILYSLWIWSSDLLHSSPPPLCLICY